MAVGHHCSNKIFGLPCCKKIGRIRLSAAILVIRGARDIASSVAGAACLLPQSPGACTVPLFLKGLLFGLCGGDVPGLWIKRVDLLLLVV